MLATKQTVEFLAILFEFSFVGWKINVTDNMKTQTTNYLCQLAVTEAVYQAQTTHEVIIKPIRKKKNATKFKIKKEKRAD
jgi:hypothetical protein